MACKSVEQVQHKGRSPTQRGEDDRHKLYPRGFEEIAAPGDRRLGCPLRAASRAQALLPDDHPENESAAGAAVAAPSGWPKTSRRSPCASRESVVRELEACRTDGEAEFVRDTAMGAIVQAARAAAARTRMPSTSAASRRNRTCSEPPSPIPFPTWRM